MHIKHISYHGGNILLSHLFNIEKKKFTIIKINLMNNNQLLTIKLHLRLTKLLVPSCECVITFEF